MLGRKILIIFAFLLTCGVPSTLAQSKFEVAPFFGAKYGGRIIFNSPFVDYDKIKSSEDFGVLFGYNIWDTFQAEFMWNRQPTTLSSHSPSSGTFTFAGNTNMDMYQFDLLYPFRSSEAKLRPFVGGGLGWTHFGNGDQILGFSNRFSYNLGGGVKYFFTQVVGVRMDVRYLATRTTPTQSQECDPFSGLCFTVETIAHAKQGEANLGLIFRF
jgi:opacity protein-like surface antigen